MKGERPPNWDEPCRLNGRRVIHRRINRLGTRIDIWDALRWSDKDQYVAGEALGGKSPITHPYAVVAAHPQPAELNPAQLKVQNNPTIAQTSLELPRESEPVRRLQRVNGLYQLQLMVSLGNV